MKTTKKMPFLVVVLAFVAVAAFASPPPAGMYECDDASYRVAYVKISYSRSDSATLTFYDTNQRKLWSTRGTVGSNSDAVSYWDDGNIRNFSNTGGNTIRHYNTGKTYTRVHDFTYDQ